MPAQIPYEEQARNLLNNLQGYHFRQPATLADIRFLTSILYEWDRQVVTLSRQLAIARRQPLPSMPKPSFWSYVKFLMGALTEPVV